MLTQATTPSATPLAVSLLADHKAGSVARTDRAGMHSVLPTACLVNSQHQRYCDTVGLPRAGALLFRGQLVGADGSLVYSLIPSRVPGAGAFDVDIATPVDDAVV